MYEPDSGPSLERATAAFPLPQRAGLRFFRAMGRSALNLFGGIGARILFCRELGAALKEGRTWSREVMHQMRSIGVDSLPLTLMVAAFIGGVITIQVRYQLFQGMQLSIVGLSARQIVILETGPLLTGLVLAGRVGAHMTAEIATMRVTEQVDALETLAFNPVAYLIVPRIIASIIMLPILTVFADAIGVLSGLMASVTVTDVQYAQFMEGVMLGYAQFQVTYSLIKATLFGAAIAFLCTYEGYTTAGGAEGVGRSTAKAVVVSSIAILILDAITAVFLAPYLQA